MRSYNGDGGRTDQRMADWDIWCLWEDRLSRGQVFSMPSVDGDKGCSFLVRGNCHSWDLALDGQRRDGDGPGWMDA